MLLSTVRAGAADVWWLRCCNNGRSTRHGSTHSAAGCWTRRLFINVALSDRGMRRAGRSISSLRRPHVDGIIDRVSNLRRCGGNHPRSGNHDNGNQTNGFAHIDISCSSTICLRPCSTRHNGRTATGFRSSGGKCLKSGWRGARCRRRKNGAILVFCLQVGLQLGKVGAVTQLAGSRARLFAGRSSKPNFRTGVKCAVRRCCQNAVSETGFLLRCKNAPPRPV